jgi:spore germination cell wall hydrolase CwlJ-like protein
MEAVMWVVQNRHVGSKGKTGVCNVIARRGAFEGVTKPRFQPQLVAIRQGRQLLQVRTRDVVERRALREARQFAAAIVSRERTHDLTQGATHFYAPIAQGRLNRQTPSWAKEYVQTASIGGHRFFRED